MRAMALTLDLDGPSEYARLHGVACEPADPLAMYGRPLERFLELKGELAVPATLFVIGRDLERGAGRVLRGLAGDGLEVASHSYGHDYRLGRRSGALVRADVERARRLFEDALGARPAGFRAPGYQPTSVLLDALEEQGFAYDSSVFPSPPYWLAKALVVGAYRLLGRPTQAHLGSPRLAIAPRRPYRPGPLPYTPGPRAIWELPIAVATAAGLPVTGATLELAPAPLRGLLAASQSASPVVVVGLHAMDFVERGADPLPDAIVARQPELRLAWPERRRRLLDALRAMASGREALTCGEVVQRLRERDAEPGESAPI